jgi:hypothetical protein
MGSARTHEGAFKFITEIGSTQLPYFFLLDRLPLPSLIMRENESKKIKLSLRILITLEHSVCAGLRRLKRARVT